MTQFLIILLDDLAMTWWRNQVSDRQQLTNSAMITYAKNSRTNGPPYEMSSFYFYHQNQFKVFHPGLYAVHNKTFPAMFSVHSYTIGPNNCWQSLTWLRHQVMAKSSNKITQNWVTTQFRFILLDDLAVTW